MRVTLVHPAGFNFVPGQPDFSVLANRMVPIGVLQLASWLERHGHPTAVHDCLGPHSPADLDGNVELILSTEPQLVGFSSTTSGFIDAIELARRIEARAPDVRIICGNVHVSSIGAPILDHFPEIDYLCIGEGEGPLLDLADGKPLAEIANLVFRDPEQAGRIVANPRRNRITNLDDLPFPAYEKLAGFPQGYYLPLFSYERRWGATMVSSRGCPYTCSFCDRTVFERRYRANSAAYIYAHMKHLRDRFGVHHINIYDDLFTANKKRIKELCRLLTEQPLGVQFNCAIRTGQTSDEMLRELKAAGALMVSIGIESADPAMMERHKAGVSLVAVRDTVRQIHAAGLRAKGLFIFGLPGETPETVRTTSDFILSLDLDEMNMTKFCPMYGAPIWDECKDPAAGDFVEDWRLMNCCNFVFRPAGFENREEMDGLYNWHIQRFYNSKEYRRRFARRLWAHRHSLWHMIRNLPQVLKARRYFHAKRSELETQRREFARHPRQPVDLNPLLSPGLQGSAPAGSGAAAISPRIPRRQASAIPATAAGD